ncbi:MAG: hypothetical protein LBG60_12005 [Bifidobacteriaceae bacterium]|nr:hypothetical protein [Bifidobacteriaceae bacterium]
MRSAISGPVSRLRLACIERRTAGVDAHESASGMLHSTPHRDGHGIGQGGGAGRMLMLRLFTTAGARAAG